ncbi:MAG: DUF2512 family protein [Tumebacillaceae bacterium]
MRQPVRAFVVKFLSSLAAVYFIALFFPLLGSMNFLHALLIALEFTVIGVVADLIVPRAVNNIVAVAGDFAIAALLTYWGNYYLPGMNVSGTFAILVGMLVAGVEIFFHARFVRTRM